MKQKNIFLSVFAILFSMSALSGCGNAAGTQSGGGSMLSMLPFLAIIVVMWIVMIIPENKRKKKAQEMRDSVEVGDKITTIGGIVGKVVHVTENTITFETGEDRVRLEINKWALSSNEGKGANKETVDSQEKLNG